VVSPTLPRSSTRCVHSSPARRGGGIRSTCSRDVCYAARYLPSGLDALGVRASSSISQVTPDMGFVPPQMILVTGLSENSGVGVEPALGEPSENRRLVGSKVRAGHPQAGQHVIWSNQRYLMRESHR
jgi:hypothetical protein